ncbi:MAG: gliding motility protein GldM [Bacteroidaceae bacterium]|nr:gliding motility protein GldM [Bacteroidaceae bacterium]
MGVKKRPVSPRQRMINLMYIVLMAMLALNISSDVLNGFTLVDESLKRSTSTSTNENNSIYDDFVAFMKKNPEKVHEWYEKAQRVRFMSDSLYGLAEQLKVQIIKEADGDDSDGKELRNKEDLEASTYVMLAPGVGKGKMLRKAIEGFRSQIVDMVPDPDKKKIIEDNLSTSVPRKARVLGKNWQEYMFENIPAAAAVTLLTKLQNDVRYAEGEVLHTLVQNIDLKDIRVNQLNAYVIPNSQTIVRGGSFSAQILMAAVDTTQRPQIYVGGRQINSNGRYETVCGKTGDFTLTGYIEMNNGQGEKVRRDFSQKYTVVDPSATVSATLMNVLYAGYNNPISISVPGVPSSQIVATASGGTLQPVSAGHYIARPSSVGKDVVITVSAKMQNRIQEMGKFTFRSRKLPDPTPYISLGANRYLGGSPLSKSTLLGLDGIGAAIDDGLLNIEFRVLGFETVFFDNMGNAIPELSSGSHFSSRQKDMFRSLSHGKRFYISHVRAIGPDGIERRLPSSMEVIVN